MIEANKWLYAIDNRGEQKMFKITQNNKLKWRKKTLLPQNFLGKPLNSVFHIDQQGKITLETKTDIFFFPHDNEGEFQVQEEIGQHSESENEAKDNRNLFDRNTSQKLSQEEIMELKQNIEGDEIVKKIVSNSETFKQKTQYSQIKYIKKKASKFIIYICIQEPTLDRIQQCWYSESPAKINFMRMDALALFLQLSSITLNSNILFCDNTFALALAGVIQRVHQNGQITAIFSQLNKNQCQDMLPLAQMNLSQEQLNLVKQKKVDEIEKNEKFTHILIAGEFNYIEIIENFNDQLQPGGNITVYSSFLEQITELAEYINQLEQFSHPTIIDSFLREQQVLPNRTHPLVEMDCFSGYLLSVTKLV